MHIYETICPRSKINTNLESLTFDLQIWIKVKSQFWGHIDISVIRGPRSKINTDLESTSPWHWGQGQFKRSHAYLRNYMSLKSNQYIFGIIKIRSWNLDQGQIKANFEATLISQKHRYHKSKIHTDLKSPTFHLDTEVKFKGQGQSSIQRSHAYVLEAKAKQILIATSHILHTFFIYLIKMVCVLFFWRIFSCCFVE